VAGLYVKKAGPAVIDETARSHRRPTSIIQMAATGDRPKVRVVKRLGDQAERAQFAYCGLPIFVSVWTVNLR
jgi:hypothetical protein